MVNGATGWAEFLRWGGKFFAMPEFDEEERNYKLRAVQPMADARKVLLARGDYLSLMHRGFKNTDQNLVSHWQFTPFLAWIKEEPAEAERALRALWAEADLDAPTRLDGLDEALPQHVLSGQGVRCNLAAYLLGALKPMDWPNYKVTATELAYELTRMPSLSSEENASMGKRYQKALDFFDRLVAEAKDMSLPLRDRLDAQGIMWSVIQWPTKPATFTDEEWSELLEYRAVPAKIKKAPRPAPKVTKPAVAPKPVCPLCGHDDEVRLLGRSQGYWVYVCETGPGHADPYQFAAGG